MTLEKIILDAKLINDNTDIWIRDCEFQTLAHGNWYQDSVLDYMHNEIESFTWQDDNKLYIDVKYGLDKRYTVVFQDKRTKEVGTNIFTNYSLNAVKEDFLKLYGNDNYKILSITKIPN